MRFILPMVEPVFGTSPRDALRHSAHRTAGTTIAVELELRAFELVAMVDIAVWFVAGAVVGGVASLLMRGDEDPGVFFNVLVGVAGALLAGWFVAPYLGLRIASAGVFGFGALAVALVGAVALLAVVGAVRRRRPR
jgi:uncharacterized membrane protein YeaQ/YmgE (transglycosylase-associated protein family)